MVLISLTTLALIAVGLVLQIMNRRAWRSAIAAFESRITTVETRAFAEAQARLEIAARVENTETALAELRLREADRRSRHGRLSNSRPRFAHGYSVDEHR